MRRISAGPMAVALSLWSLSAAASGLNIVATTGMVGDMAREVAGSCAEIEVMMGPGIDPHLYQPRAGDVQALQGADAILYNGLFLEGQLGEVFERLSRRTPTLAIAEAGVLEADRIATGDSYGVDPHVWMDAALWSGTAAPVAEALGPLDTDCAADMTERATAYAAALGALDTWIRDSIATIPEGARVLVSAHDAFGYYGRAYGLEVVGVQGISTEAEAGIADIRQTVDLVVDRQIPAIFVESTINPRTVEAVVEAAADRGHTLSIGSELYSDAMGEEGTAAGTYIGMLHANTVAIVEALGGTLLPLPEALHPWADRWDMPVGGS